MCSLQSRRAALPSALWVSSRKETGAARGVLDSCFTERGSSEEPSRGTAAPFLFLGREARALPWEHGGPREGSCKRRGAARRCSPSSGGRLWALGSRRVGACLRLIVLDKVVSQEARKGQGGRSAWDAVCMGCGPRGMSWRKGA